MWWGHRSRLCTLASLGAANFTREQVAKRREGLRLVLDQAATYLAVAPTNLRIIRQGRAGDDEVVHARAWLGEVFPIGMRLRLWLPLDDEVIVSYERLRASLVAAAEARGDDEEKLLQFEGDRSRFLDAARVALMRKIPETGASL